MTSHRHCTPSSLIAQGLASDNLKKSSEKIPCLTAKDFAFGPNARVRQSIEGLADLCAEYFSSTRRFLSWVFESKRT